MIEALEEAYAHTRDAFLANIAKPCPVANARASAPDIPEPI